MALCAMLASVPISACSKGGGETGNIAAPTENTNTVSADNTAGTDKAADAQQPVVEQPTDAGVPNSHADYSTTLPQTVLESTDADVTDAAVVQQVTDAADTAIGAMAQLPSTTEYNESVWAVIRQYFISGGNESYIYEMVCDNAGHLDCDSVRVWSADGLDDGVYKVAFKIADANGNDIGEADGYYQMQTNMFKISNTTRL